MAAAPDPRPADGVALPEREAEVAAARAAVDAARTGTARVLVLSGPPGVGTSTVLEASLPAPGPDVAVVRTRGVEGGAPWPLEGLVALLVELRRASPSTTDATDAALALWSDAGGSAGAADGLALAVAAHEAVTTAASARPLVVAVDDAHWLDPDSARALAFLARRLDADAVAVLVAHRAPLAGTVWAGLPSVDVAPLDDAAARSLVLAHAPVEVAAPVLDRVVAACAGNALALQEVVAALSHDQLLGRVALDDPLPVGPLLEKAALEPIEDLGPDERAALLVVAAVGHAPRPVVARACEALGVGSGALGALERRGLVSTGAECAAHDPILRSAALRRAEPESRRAAHRALADALGPGAPAAAWHRAELVEGEDEEVARALVVAARDAHRRGAPASASRLLERAAQLTPDPARRGIRLLAAAGAAQEVGATTTVATLVDRARRALAAAPGAPSTAVALDARIAAAALVDEGRPGAALQVLLDAGAALADADGAAAAAVLLDVVPVALRVGRLDVASRAVGDAERAWAGAGARPGRDPESARVPARLEVARAAAATAEAAAGAADDLLSVLSRQVGIDTSTVECAGLALVWAERLDDARAVLARAEGAARRDGSAGRLTVVRGLQAFAALRASRLGEAAAAAEEASTLAEHTGRTGVRAFPDAVGAVVAAMRGDGDGCRAAADRLLAAAARGGELPWDVPARAALGLLALGGGRAGEAVEHLAPLLERPTGPPWLVMWEPDLAEAMVREGRAADAAPIVERLAAAGATSPRAAAAATRLRGLLTADDDEAVAHLERAAQGYVAAGVPFGVARARLNAGARLRRGRRRAEARPHLEEALRTFEAIGADQWARVALGELRASGGGPVADDPVTLTPQELQVATMVAAGASNREVAAALFISTRTVESHLSRTYRKVGVRSRGELAAVARTWPRPPGPVA